MALTVISANVEGLTASKASILSEMCKEQHCHCLCLQETHRSKNQAKQLCFIRDGLKVSNISVCEEVNVELITVELPGVVVHSMYKPPPEPFRVPVVVVIDLPLLRVAVEGSDNPVSLEKPCQASLPPDQQGRHSLGRHPEVQYVA